MFLRTITGGLAFTSACCIAGAKTTIAASSGHRRLDVFRSEVLRRALVGKTMAQVRTATEHVFSRLHWISRTTEALIQHRNEGRHILVATGSLSVYVPALLEMKGICIDGLLATEIGVDGDVLTGEMITASCTGVEKARRVREWLAGIGGPVWGYGNLPHDAAMLALTDYPTVIPILRQRPRHAAWRWLGYKRLTNFYV
ncbi:HAD-superfamily subfamily IB hydrolase, TIGR01490 [invertebrate metagenome]|uniref:HAD-superfamily subfamily IB hydrolase, TIGR01490 n=1 Tax=invertebrate metagenome TaxID=1711999 RepID=A0A484H873_9ZZZZ